MIIFKKNQNIFNSTARYIVNPVNSKGTSGKGLAEQFKNKFPKNFEQYKAFCKESSRSGGDLFWFDPEIEDILKGYRGIINVLTKENWRNPSKIEWIEKALKGILVKIDEYYTDGNYSVPLIAFPMIGCGEGGLDRKEVTELIKKIFKDCLFDIEVYT